MKQHFTYLSVFLFLSLAFSSCQKSSEELKKNPVIGYDLVEGKYVENIVEELRDQMKPNPYNYDNEIYIGDRAFIFEYSFPGDNILPLKFRYSTYNRRNPVRNAPPCYVDSLGNERSSIWSAGPSPASSQGTARFCCFIENDKNVYFPFSLIRNAIVDTFGMKISDCYESFDDAPYPFIMKDKMPGATWTLERKQAKPLSPRSRPLTYHYQHDGVTIIETPLGELYCEKIKVASAQLRATDPKLTCYFNAEYGFVKLDYELKCGLEVQIDLVEISDRFVKS